MPGGRCSRAQALLHSSHLYSEVKNHASNYGVSVDGVHMDVGKMMAQKDKAVVGLTKGIEGLFKKNKVRRAAPCRSHMPSQLRLLTAHVLPTKHQNATLMLATSLPASRQAVMRQLLLCSYLFCIWLTVSQVVVTDRWST